MTQNEKAAAAKKRSHAIMIIVLILLFILFIIPFIMVIINVFKVKTDIVSNPLSLVGEHGFTLQNFPNAMAKMNFLMQQHLINVMLRKRELCRVKLLVSLLAKNKSPMMSAKSREKTIGLR